MGGDSFHKDFHKRPNSRPSGSSECVGGTDHLRLLNPGRAYAKFLRWSALHSDDDYDDDDEEEEEEDDDDDHHHHYHHDEDENAGEMQCACLKPLFACTFLPEPLNRLEIPIWLMFLSKSSRKYSSQHVINCCMPAWTPNSFSMLIPTLVVASAILFL